VAVFGLLLTCCWLIYINAVSTLQSECRSVVDNLLTHLMIDSCSFVSGWIHRLDLFTRLLRNQQTLDHTHGMSRHIIGHVYWTTHVALSVAHTQ